ncbi:uncharacterized protein CC84DRAFT_806200 [Paraphaeosphaeria sporulosa]|uniref:Uncharacterized protein n=1 Tax=Paraphaeosphaeria sporulosa TaxID=1460663 RepID=A0A177CD98_9PLEO|nr:uncharacterized protein CC84DRAFT_806200 [Paraphaeosphaeria sporulosa]OAG04852.1 hypothetical protein CC84DRAFT_806200 [Paraphaeosphaeria sporulosa]
MHRRLSPHLHLWTGPISYSNFRYLSLNDPVPKSRHLSPLDRLSRCYPASVFAFLVRLRLLGSCTICIPMPCALIPGHIEAWGALLTRLTFS